MRRFVLHRLCALVALTVLAAVPASAAEILWRLDNPFRLFTEAEATHVHRDVFEQLTEAEKLEPIVSAERRLMEKFPFGWARESFATTCWDRDNAVYGACGNDQGYVNPKSHRVLVQVDHPELVEGDCDWSVVNGTGADDAEEQHVHVGCGGQVALDIPYPTGALVRVTANGLSVGETIIKVDDILVVAIGDSFGSGEGNPDQAVEFSRDRTIDYGKGPGGVELAGYPARVGDWGSIGDKTFLSGGPRWLSPACHRSLYAYSTRTALQLALDNPHRAVTYANFACAGAEIVYGLLVAYKGPEWAKDQPDRPQVSAVARLQCGATQPTETNYQNTYSLNGVLPELDNIVLATCPRNMARRIDLLMVSVGGNDVGFARVVANAILADKGLLKKLGGWMGEIEEADGIISLLPTLEKRFQSLNRALHGHLQIPWDQSDRILLTAYPVMALEENGNDVCPEGQSGMTVFPEFVLNREKAKDNEAAAEKLNRSMRKAAKTYGWTYVEQHRAEFAGHGVCAGVDEGALGFSDDSRMPRMINGAWTPYNPAEFRPYVPRRRWYRTPNDAFLTGNYHISSTILKSVMNLQSIEWFQLVLASTYSGAFHPTSEGQAVIADAVLEKARVVLDKYDRKRAQREAAKASGRGR
jgi:hypothetical protein